MTTRTIASSSDTFISGWIVLLFFSGCALLNHMLLPVYDKNNLALAIGWVAFSLYAMLVLAIPFRRGKRWAWYISWIQVIVFGSLIFLDADPELRGVVIMYVTAAGVMALCLFVTRPAFFRSE